MLEDPQLKVELKLTEVQLEGLRTVKAKLKELMKDIQAKDLRIPEVRQEFAVARAEHRKIAVSAVEEILLPEQLTRLKQMVYRMEIANMGWSRSLVLGRLGLAVGVYENQNTQIEDRVRKIMAETDAKIAQLKQDAERQILEELAPEQRKKAQDLIGDFADYKIVSPAERSLARMAPVQDKPESK